MRAVCEAHGGAGSIWKYLEALARATRVSGRFALGFRTDLHFADVYSSFERHYFANHLRFLVGFNECTHNVAYCSEEF